jgi:hypothetical protein
VVNCGITTSVYAKADGKVCKLSITSECKAIQKLAQELMDVTIKLAKTPNP